jgi:hypothetical protein
MKILAFAFLLISISVSLSAQVLIHSHNDYVHARPFQDAFQADAYSIEADIYVRDNNLLVAHAANEIKAGVTLEKLYLEPLTKACINRMQSASAEKKTLPLLLIDFKDEQQKVMPLLLTKLLEMKKQLRAKGIDTMPVVVITGNRPPADSFATYPAYVQFDGRPYEQYDKAAMQKVAFISDQYLKYSSWNGKDAITLADSATMTRLIQSVHDKGKMLRLWNTPDTEAAWKSFQAMGVDIINTDQPLVCRKFFRGLDAVRQ